MRSIALFAVIWGSVALYAGFAAAFWPFVADDAYIVGRYAENVWRGHGLVYNPGEPVTALTSPLHALVLTGIAGWSDDPVRAYRFLALFLPPLGLWIAARIYRPERAELAIVALMGLGSPFLALWAGGGLETPILTALLAIWGAVLLRVAERNSAETGDFLAAGALAGAAFLTRFDSILITLPVMLCVIPIAWRRPALWAGAGLMALCAAVWFGFSRAYYGEFLPTSAFVKLGNLRSEILSNFAALLNMALLSGALLWFLLGPRKLRREIPDLTQALGQGARYALIAFVTYAAMAAAAHMMFGYRFFVPVLILTAMVLARRVATEKARLWPLLAGQAALHLAFGFVVLTTGMNPYPIRHFGPLGNVLPEMHGTTPRDYGVFMATLEADAADLQAHWAAAGQAGPARAHLYTGGMGYWLPEFYIYETLISYRHHCGENLGAKLAASHYVQDLNIAPNPILRSLYDAIPDRAPPAHLSLSHLKSDVPWELFYKFSPDVAALDLPARVDDPC